MMKNTFGFTMIELLLVVSVVGILSGIMLMVINPGRSQNIAQDGVRISTLEGLAQVMQTVSTIEGSYPTGTGDVNLAVYLDSWPTTGEAGVDYRYATQTNTGVDYVCLSVQMATVNTLHFKYVFPHGPVTGGDEDCVGRILKNCNIGCPNYGIGGGDCVMLNDSACTP